MAFSISCEQDPGPKKTVHILLSVYLCFIVVCAFTPFTFSLDSSSSLFELYSEKFDKSYLFWSLPKWDFISNILLFVPFGLCFVALPIFSTCSPLSKLLSSTVSACVLSFTIEMCQLFLPRAPSLNDIILNSIGGATGAVLGIYVNGSLNRLSSFWWMDIRRSLWISLFLITYVFLLLAASSFPLPLGPNFSNWDTDYPLQLGNEATLDRPWLGKIFLLAVYDRALSPDEVFANFLEGSSSDSQQNRSNEGVVAFYDFQEGAGSIIHDRSGRSQSIDLQIQNTQHVKWLRPNGLEILKSTRIESARVPSKLYTSKVLSDSELTVEVWIASSNLKQYGPARIVTLSRDTELRNFTLGQTSQDVEFRLRTAVSGLNGMRPKLRTTDRPLTIATQHFVITYRLGVETLYVNGQKHLDIDLDRSLFAFRVLDEIVGWEYRWAYWFLVIVPVGFLTSMFAKLRWGHMWITLVASSLCTIGLICVVELLQVMTGQRAHDLFFIPVGSGIALLSVVAGYNIVREVDQFNLCGISTDTAEG